MEEIKKETPHTGKIPVAAFLPRSLVNGPGVRSVLWVQGCPFRCEGCFNPKFIEFRKDREVDIKTVETWIRDAKGTEGVTFSGGEPFYYAAALLPLTERIKRDNKSVVIFTGYSKKDILLWNDPAKKELAAKADMIIAGPYKKDNPGKHPLLSSGNQRLILPGERYRKWKLKKGAKRVEFRISPSGVVKKSGLLADAYSIFPL